MIHQDKDFLDTTKHKHCNVMDFVLAMHHMDFPHVLYAVTHKLIIILKIVQSGPFGHSQLASE